MYCDVIPPADLSEMTIICETMTVTTAGARVFQLGEGLPRTDIISPPISTLHIFNPAPNEGL
jgi:hypothetical protein